MYILFQARGNCVAAQHRIKNESGRKEGVMNVRACVYMCGLCVNVLIYIFKYGITQLTYYAIRIYIASTVVWMKRLAPSILLS